MVIRVTRGRLGGADPDEFIRIAEEQTMIPARGLVLAEKSIRWSARRPSTAM